MTQLSGLRWRLAGTLALALLPVALLGVVAGALSLVARVEDQRENFVMRALEIADQESLLFENILNMLATLSDQPSILAAQDGVCAQTLGTAMGRMADLSSLEVLDAEGQTVCVRGEPLSRSAERAWFNELGGGQARAISGYAGSAEDDHGRIVLATAIRSENEFRGALAGTVSTRRLARLAREISLEEGGRADLLDADSAFLSAAADELPVMALPESYFRTVESARARNGPLDVFLARSEAGEERLYALTPMLPGGELFLMLSRPAPSAIEGGTPGIWLQIAIPFLLWGIGVMAAWLATDRLVLRWVRRQRRLVRRFQRQEWNATADARGAPQEFRELFGGLTELAHDIAEREQDLRTTLAEKNLLIKEIHHRVKNNLQIITSLLNLQGQQASDEGERRILSDAQGRINALALVHNALYETEGLERVELTGFLTRLAGHLADLATTQERRVAVRVDCPTLLVNADRAIPLALITSEAVTNCIQHGLRDVAEGVITISVTPNAMEPTRHDIMIRDNGGHDGHSELLAEPAGPPERTRVGIGMALMRSFARQLAGYLEIGDPGGEMFVAVRQARLDEPG